MDAAVATLFCIGVVSPQSAGIGGGLLMTIYNSTSASAACLNAREAAPLDANRDMFQKNAALAYRGSELTFVQFNRPFIFFSLSLISM